MSTRSKSYALTQFRIPCPERASHTSPGCQPWEFTRQKNLRSEGTPHNLRVSDIEPGTPYAVFLQNTPILWDAVPRAMPWAGMRYPFRVYYAMTVSDIVFDRCGPKAKYENRGHRTRLQWRRRRLCRCFGLGSSVAAGLLLGGSVSFLGLSLWLTRFPNGSAAAGEGHADHEQR